MFALGDAPRSNGDVRYRDRRADALGDARSRETNCEGMAEFDKF
jgi:hypothetical protein